MRLYQPIQYGGRFDLRADDPTASYIGGPASPSGRKCPLCQQTLMTLLQLHIPASERSLRVEACNSARCFRQLFDGTSKFHLGGSGVVLCERIRADESLSLTPKQETVVKSNVGNKTKAVDDWGVSTDGDSDDLDDLEAKLAAMESSAPRYAQGSKKAKSSSRPTPRKNESSVWVLPIMPLHSIQEPVARNVSKDPRDVGLHGTSNRKIEEMLARYLENEEDQDIVEMLQGSGSDGGASGQEPDQDLTEDEMALLRFSDRIKRCPRQVLRYARGGEPLWSMYVSLLRWCPWAM